MRSRHKGDYVSVDESVKGSVNEALERTGIVGRQLTTEANLCLVSQCAGQWKKHG